MMRSRLEWIISGIDYNQLSKWEDDFIDSAVTYFGRHGDLTEKQEAILERLFEEKSR